MSFHRGYGGGITIDATEVCITKWEFEKSVTRIEIITNCGRTNLGSIPQVTGTIELPWDSDNTLEDLGCDVDDTVDVELFLGDSGAHYDGSVFIERIKYSSDNTQGAVMATIGFVANLSVGTPIMTLTPAA